MITITPTLSISEDEIEERFVRASGPGGQNVNKVSTAVELRFDAARSPALDPAVFARLSRLAGRRLGRDGVLVIRAQSFRTQERNRIDALARLVALIRQATIVPRPRRATKVPRREREKRRKAKSHRSTTKKLRSPGSIDV